MDCIDRVQASSFQAGRSTEAAAVIKYMNQRGRSLDALMRAELVLIAADIALGRHRQSHYRPKPVRGRVATGEE